MKKLITILLLSGCNFLDPPTHVTDELQPFVDQVVYEYEIRGIRVEPIKVVFADLDGSSGRYENLPWERKIMIDKTFFHENIGKWDYDILKTMAHEFGHYQGRDHKNKEIEFCKPVSLMCTKCCHIGWEENYEYYFNELVGVEL